MARVPKKFKAQLLTTDKSGKQIKRNFNNIRADITDDELTQLGTALRHTLDQEQLQGMNLTSNASLALV